MLKTDPEFSNIPDTATALSKYAWDKFHCDEDTFREAIYLVINESKYAVSDSIAMMNEKDIQRAGRKTSRSDETELITFTKINRITPEAGRRYHLGKDNCQYFVARVQEKYKELETEALKSESLT